MSKFLPFIPERWQQVIEQVTKACQVLNILKAQDQFQGTSKHKKFLQIWKSLVCLKKGTYNSYNDCIWSGYKTESSDNTLKLALLYDPDSIFLV